MVSFYIKCVSLFFDDDFSPFLATWAVMSYPEIKSVVLDASFDDLLPLALKVMPDSWSESNRDLDRCHPALVQPLKCRSCLLGPLVQHTVRQYMNLNNADQLLQ